MKQEPGQQFLMAEEATGEAIDTSLAEREASGDIDYVETQDGGQVSSTFNTPESALAAEDKRRQAVKDTIKDKGLVQTAWDSWLDNTFVGDKALDMAMSDMANIYNKTDPEFDVDKAIQADSMFFSPNDRQFLADAESADNYEYRKKLLQQREEEYAYLQTLGGVGTAVGFVAGSLDLDAVIPFVGTAKTYGRVKTLQGAGKYAANGSELAKLKGTMRSLKVRNAAKTTLEAASQGAILETVNYATGEDTTIDDIGNAAMMSAAFNTTVLAGAEILHKLDGVEARAYNQDFLDTIFERNGKTTLGQKVDVVDSYTIEETTLDNVTKVKDNLYKKGLLGTKRVSVKEISPNAWDLTTNLKASDNIKDLIDAASINVENIHAKRREIYGLVDANDTKLATATKAVVDTITRKDIYHEAWDSGNVVLQSAAHDLLSDSTNYVSNINNAESFKAQVSTKQQDYLRKMDKYTSAHRKAFLKKLSEDKVNKKEYFKAQLDGDTANFMSNVHLEANARELGLVQGLSQDANITGFVNEISALSDYTLEELQDVRHNGRSSVIGTEGLEKSTYIPRKWDDFKLEKAIRKNTEEEVLSAFTASIERGYAAKNIELKEGMARIFARAIMDRARSTSDNTKKFSTAETSDDIMSTLIENGMSIQEANKIVSSIVDRNTKKGIPSFAKSRIPMDYSVELPDGTRVVDILDNDVPKLLNRYIENSSGRIALAKVGYRSDEAFNQMIKAAETVDSINKGEGRLPKVNTRQYLEDVKSYMLGYPVGDTSPVYGRVTNLSSAFMMNASGWNAQNVEWAAQLATFGVKDTMLSMRDVFKDIKNGNDASINELKVLMGEGVFNEYNTAALNANIVDMDTSVANSEHWKTFDKLLGRFLDKQQIWNGMRPLMYMQRAVATKSLLRSMNKLIDADGNISSFSKRLSDFGLTGDNHKAIMDNFKKTRKLDAQGELVDISFKDWDSDTFDEFGRALMRMSNTMVLKPRLGERRGFMSKGSARVLLQYMTYPLTAANKFFVNGARHMDAKAFWTFTISTMLAPAMYAVRVASTTADKDERANKLTLDKVVYNSMGYNTMVGWAVQPANYLASLVGAGFSPYNMPGEGLNAPALQLPVILSSPFKAVIEATTREDGISRATANKLKQLSIIGNINGLGYAYEKFVGMPLSRGAKSIKNKREKAEALEATSPLPLIPEEQEEAKDTKNDEKSLEKLTETLL